MGRLDYLKVRNITKEKADIYFYGEIVGDEWEKWCDTDTCPEDVIKALKETEGKALNIYINSPGGNVFEGLAIYNMLKRVKEKKTVYVDGVAASIASVICMAGDEIVMPKNTFIMIHKPSSMVWGNAENMRKCADDLEIIESGILEVYKEKLLDDVRYDDVKEMVNNETWLKAEDAAAIFKGITVAEENKAAARLSDKDMKCFKNKVPDEIVKTEDFGAGEIERLKMELELI